VNSSISPEQQVLLAKIAEAKKSLQALQNKLDAIDQQVLNLAEQRQQFQLLENISQALTELEEMGGGNLFWGMLADKLSRSQQLQQVKNAVGDFRRQVAEIEKQKEPLYREFRQQESAIGNLYEDLADQQEKEESAKHDYPITREVRPLPYRPMLMPWSHSGEDDRRFRKTLALVFLFVLCFNALITFWVLPEPDEYEKMEIPEHLVKLVKQETPQPKPPEKRPEEKPRESAEGKSSDSKTKPVDTAQARKKAESSGVLAFKESFSDLLGDNADAKLGSAARISTQGAKAAGNSNRNLVMAQAGSSSGGINASRLSRQVGKGSGGGNGLGGVGFSRVTSNIGGGGGGGAGRPLSDGPGPSRTDEEIQIVFDRYKAALYRIYNRELRSNPLLKGKMMLRLSIKPDGSVSLCKLESTDMDAPGLVKEVVARVQRFNFGAKAGVPTITILYPIDFLPAS
jgi:outer membrane biosynthesis protein TonB